MIHSKTSAGKWVGPINFKKLKKSIDFHKQDRYTKKLTTQSFVLLMLYSHLDEKESLYSMETAIADDKLQKAHGFSSTYTRLERR